MSNAYIKTLKDGNGNIVYPQTKTGAIYRNDNSASLDSLLDAAVYMNAEEEGVTPVTRDADTLGGYPASDYVKSVNGAIPDENGNVDVKSDVFVVTFTKDVEASEEYDKDIYVTNASFDEMLALIQSDSKMVVARINWGTYYVSGFNATAIFFSAISKANHVQTFIWNSFLEYGYYQYDILPSAKSTISTSTLLASGWSDNTYDLGNTDYNIEIELDSSATDEMIEAWTNARILGSATSNILTAKGDVPTIDITCIMKRTVK